MKHKIGIIGYGTMGSWHAASIRRRIDDLDVVAVYDINPEKLKKAEEDGFAICHSAAELLCRDVDIVLVATPNNFHKEYCIMALDSGKNVVCEKPVCLNMDELEEILAAAQRNQRVFTVHYNRRWDVDFDIVKNIVSRGLVGNVHQVYSRLFSSRNIPGDWRTRKLSGGGFLYARLYVELAIELVDRAEGAHSRLISLNSCQIINLCFFQKIKHSFHGCSPLSLWFP